MLITRLICNAFQWLDRPTVWSGRPIPGLLSLATLSIMSGVVACSSTAAGAPSIQAQAYDFYRFNPFAENELVRLDPETLADQPEGQIKAPGLFSADGSTRVDVEYPPGRDVNDPNLKPDEVWIVVRDLQTGAERSRFHPPAIGLISALSQDGTRLVILPYPPARYPLFAEWYVLDTNNGQPLAHINDADTPCFRGRAWFDQAIEKRIYCVIDPGITEADELESIRVVAYDLESGEKVGEVELPEVPIGVRQLGQTAEGQPLWESLEPALLVPA